MSCMSWQRHRHVKNKIRQNWKGQKKTDMNKKLYNKCDIPSNGFEKRIHHSQKWYVMSLCNIIFIKIGKSATWLCAMNSTRSNTWPHGCHVYHNYVVTKIDKTPQTTPCSGIKYLQNLCYCVYSKILILYKHFLKTFIEVICAFK